MIVLILRLIACGIGFYAVLASDTIGEETNLMVWAIWAYVISIALRTEELNRKSERGTNN